MSRNIEQAITLIKKYEGFRSKAYICPAGVLTIGYGHTAGVKKGDVITEEYGEKLLYYDIEPITVILDEYNKIYNWTDNEYSALLSFAYNLGTGSINQVTNYGNRSKELIAKKMLLYCNANGEKLPGLVKRREEESKLFLTPDSSGFINDTLISLKEEDKK